MKANCACLVASLFLPSADTGAAAPSAGEASAFRASARITPDARLNLCLSLSIGQTTVPESALPWGHPDSITLILVPEWGRSEQVLPQSSTFLEPGFGKPVAIGAEPVCGDVNLRERFPTLGRVLKAKKNVIVFWYYALSKEDGQGWESGGYQLIRADAPRAPSVRK